MIIHMGFFGSSFAVLFIFGAGFVTRARCGLGKLAGAISGRLTSMIIISGIG